MTGWDGYKCKACKWFHSLSYSANFCVYCAANKCIYCTNQGRNCSEYEEGLNDGGKSEDCYDRLKDEVEQFLFEFDCGYRPYPGEDCLIIELEDGKLFLCTIERECDIERCYGKHVVGVKFQQYDPETAEIISEYDSTSHRYSLRRRSD